MSRIGECANCGAPVAGAYCAACGQETRLALPTAAAFLRDALGRYVALDGRMWRTLAVLFFRPGVLTHEYLAGRRRRYVRPGRLLLVLALALFAALRITGDRADVLHLDRPATGAGVVPPPGKPLPSPGGREPSVLAIDDAFNVRLGGAKLPWLAPVRARLNDFNRLTGEQKSAQLFAGVLRFGPYALVGLLPFFAALMQLAYLGRSRRYPGRPDRYAAHLVFGAHCHAFVVLAALVAVLVRVPLVRTALELWIVAYLVLATRMVYGGRWSGVVARAALVSFVYAILFGLAVALLVVAAIVLP